MLFVLPLFKPLFTVFMYETVDRLPVYTSWLGDKLLVMYAISCHLQVAIGCSIQISACCCCLDVCCSRHYSLQDGYCCSI